MKAIILFFLTCLSLTSCTYSVTMLLTEGKASDVVEESATNKPSASLEIPASEISIPKL